VTDFKMRNYRLFSQIVTMKTSVATLVIRPLTPMTTFVAEELNSSLRSLDCFRCSLHDSDETSQTPMDALLPTLDTFLRFRDGDKLSWALLSVLLYCVNLGISRLLAELKS
jgi:hypothetical protein